MVMNTPKPWTIKRLAGTDTILVKGPRGEVIAEVDAGSPNAMDNAELIRLAPEILDAVGLFLAEIKALKGGE